jgi:hypothetical protein
MPYCLPSVKQRIFGEDHLLEWADTYLKVLRDLCVRWSFGRCFLSKEQGFLLWCPKVPRVDCRIADLECALK